MGPPHAWTGLSAFLLGLFRRVPGAAGDISAGTLFAMIAPDFTGASGSTSKIGASALRRAITAYLDNRGTLENAQLIAAHESPRTTKLYDRTGDEITVDEVERISI